MNVLFLVILTVLLVAVLSFLMPWISKTIEEPFQGQGCLNPSATQAIVIPVQGPTAVTDDYIETGKQRYNLLGFLQAGREDRAFMTPTAIGSISTEVDMTASETTNTPLKRLNESIRAAFQTVDIVPGASKITVRPDVDSVQGPSGTQTVLKNAAAFFTDVLGAGRITGQVLGNVEERLPPLDGRKDDAARCEVNNMHYSMSTAPTSDFTSYASPVGNARKRQDMCRLLDEPKNEVGKNQITNAFPNAPTKICGVCIKNATPYTEAVIHNPDGKAYNGIGGMFLSQANKNEADAAQRPYKPSLGSCEEGYFFIPGEADKCMKTAQRLNCEEIAVTGGFSGVAMDGTDISGSNCRACVNGTDTRFVYYEKEGTPQSIRVRVVVPTGTGRTFLRVNKILAGGTGDGTSVGTYTIISKKSNTVQNNEFVTSGTPTQVNNTVYFTVEVEPGEFLLFNVAQEFPHRPRGEKEVFFAKYPDANTSGVGSFGNHTQFANSLDCDLATPAQLVQAQQEGMNVCDIGVASDGKKYTVFVGTLTDNPFDGSCAVNPAVGNVTEVQGTPTGIWCYGIKPAAAHLSTALFEAPVGTVFNTNVANHYTYYKQTNETNIPPEARVSRWSSKQANTYPNFRGICIQLERNDTANTDAYQSINAGAENHIVTVGTTDVSSVRILAERLRYYSRNGRFNDSERIATPKPSNTGPLSLLNQQQYWIWAPVGEGGQSPQFTFKVEVPAFFYPATHQEDRAICRGPLYTTQTYLTRAIGSACDGGINEEDTTGCLAQCFASVGGTSSGKLNPSLQTLEGAKSRRLLMYKDVDRRRDIRTAAEVVQFLKERYVDVAKGTSSTLGGLSQPERAGKINEASQALIGRDAVGPCQKFVEREGASGRVLEVRDFESIAEVDEKCLDFLYRNTTGESRNPTYSNMGNRFSGLAWPGEYTTATEAEKEAFPYKACQPTGSWAPLGNPQAVAEIKDDMNELRTNATAIQKAIAVFNKTYQDANSSTDAATQEAALKRCYGITKKSYVTNCDGIPTRFLFVYQLPAATFLDTIGYTFRVSDGKNTTEISTNSTAGYTELSKGAQTYTMTQAITGVYTNFMYMDGTSRAVTIASDTPLSRLRIVGATALGTLVSGEYSVTDVSEGSDRVFILTDGTGSKMVRIRFQKAASTNLQVRIDEVRQGSAWLAGRRLTTDLDDRDLARNGIAVSDTDVGYGVKDLQITFEDPDIGRTYYQFTGDTPVPVQSVEISRNTRTSLGTDSILVLLRDGDSVEDGVAAQKLVRPANASSVTVKFLQEDLRPLIPYSVAVIRDGATFRFESAIGKQYFLQRNGSIVRQESSDAADDTKFMLGPSVILKTTGSPINTLKPMNDDSVFLTKAADDSVSSVATGINKDWSIVPAINGAYAFVSIMLANIPGYFLKAVPGTGDSYTVKAARIDPDEDVDTFLACWRLYPAL